MHHELMNSSDFERNVERWILKALRPGMTFDQLLQALPSVYPTAVAQALKLLVAQEQLTLGQVESLYGRREPGSNVAATAGLLPLPHPVNFEWRFTSESSRFLLQLASETVNSCAPVLLFGTPGVAAEALLAPVSQQVIFAGEDNAVTRRIASLNRAMDSPISVQTTSRALPTSGAVIVDPPWYLDVTLPMMAATANSLDPSGWMFVSLPPEGVRPTANADRISVLKHADEIGLQVVGQYARSLRYQTPFFERNALSAAGLAVLSDWRAGDLVVFRKVRAGTARTARPQSSMATWVEIEIGGMRVFVRTGAPSVAGPPRLGPLGAATVLPTVRRRDRRRLAATVVTSGNRVFSGPDPRLVIEAAILASEATNGSGGLPPVWCKIEEQAAIEQMATELREIADIEAAELRASTLYQGERGSLACTLRSMTSEMGSPPMIFG